MTDYTSSHTGAVIDSAVTKATKLATIAGGDALKVPRVNAGETVQELIAPGTIIAAAIVAASAKGTPIDADTVALIDSADSNTLKEVTVAVLKSTVLNATDLATLLVAASAKTTLVGADTMPIIDSEASSALKEVTMADVLAYIGAPLNLRIHNRAFFEKKSTTELYLSGGRYFHKGTTDQYVYWNSKLTYTFTGLAASSWHYLYIDDSAVVSKGDGITESTPAPEAYEPITGGCYHGTNTKDLCIFAVLTNADSEILGFTHSANFIQLGDEVVDPNNYDFDATWVDLAMTVPTIADAVLTKFRVKVNSGAGTALVYRPKGSTDGGIGISYVDASEPVSTVYPLLAIGTDRSIQLKFTVSGVQTANVSTNGWFFGKGL
jgi:hypothetical protein